MPDPEGSSPQHDRPWRAGSEEPKCPSGQSEAPSPLGQTTGGRGFSKGQGLQMEPSGCPSPTCRSHPPGDAPATQAQLGVPAP